MSQLTGWAREKEDLSYLHEKGITFASKPLTYGAPAEFIPDAIIVSENQSSMSSCTGHGQSNAVEACYWIADGADPTAKPKQFSRMMAYIIGQKESGMLGNDNGATIAGVTQGTADVGLCLESTFPYPTRYTTHIPDAAMQEAAKYKTRSHSSLKSYDEVMNYQQSGIGGIVIGITWTNALANNTSGVVRLQDVKGNGGGHCVFLWGWDTQGRIRLHNSWGTTWGRGGRVWVEPDVVKYWADNNQAELIGVSDLTGVDVQRPMADFTAII